MDRRDFLKMMGVASGASVLAGCNLDRTSEKLIPYLVPPEDGVIPGDAIYKASTCTECPVGCGVSVRIREERPVKLEGLDGHPAGEGALCVRGQASLNRLYHPDRIRQPLMADGNGGHIPGTWNQVYARVVKALGDSRATNYYLSDKTSGTMSALVDEFCERMSVSKRPEFELYAHAAIREANRMLFGRAVVPTYRVDRADFMLTLGAGMTETFVNPVTHQAQVAEHRRQGHFEWTHVEPHVTLSGLNADHRLSVNPGTEWYVLAYLVGELSRRRIFSDRNLESLIGMVPRFTAADVSSATGVPTEKITALGTSFLDASKPLVVSGEVSTRHELGLEVAWLTGLLQAATGMIGDTVDLDDVPDYSRVGSMADLNELRDTLDAGQVGVLFVANVDPLVSATDDGFSKALDKAGFIVGMGDFMTPTLERCDVVLPLSHALESWGDHRPTTGTLAVIQPVIEPVFDTRSLGDVLLQLMAEAGRPSSALSYQQFLFNRWNGELGSARVEALLRDGHLDTGVTRTGASLAAGAVSDARRLFGNADTPAGPVLIVAPSVRTYDGRSGALPLLHEIPDPLTTITWDYWVSVSPATARQHGFGEGDQVELSSGGWKAQLPVHVQRGLPDDVFMVHDGFAKVPLSTVAATGEASAYVGGVSVAKAAGRHHVAMMSGSLTEEGRGIVPGSHPDHFGHAHMDEDTPHEDVSFNPVPDYPKYNWGMAIDMDLCTGCSACVAACYVENNVPVVGREEHLKGREMSWLRIEPYYEDHEGEAAAEFVPMMCQHCDHAPCEPVCPVYATYHSDEGMNNQVYNRCVGTRYCANNCPYKVRRFNWFSHENREAPLDKLVNPDVSLRGKGIMEKCTFCVQRVRKARDIAKDEKRDILDGDVVTACQQACPGDAIVFGNLKDDNSEVSQWARSDRAIRVLEELGTSPSVYYLKSKKKGTHDNGHH